MVVLPKVFVAIMKMCTNDFQPLERIIIELSCEDLDPSIYLHVRHFEDFNVDLLMAQMEILNSSKKFRIDKSFRIRLTKVSNVHGGKRLYVHSTADRNRMSKSLIAVHVGHNLCLPAALYLGKFRLTKQVGVGEVDYQAWKNIRRKDRVNKLEQLVTEELSTSALPAGKMYDLSAVDEIQKKL